MKRKAFALLDTRPIHRGRKMIQGNRAFMLVFFVFTPGFALAQTPGQIAKFDANGTTVVDSVVTEDEAGNIGIGTTTPAEPLDVVGNASFSGRLSASEYNIGSNRVVGILGPSNLFVGVGAGQSNTTGFNNTASGANALFSNTAGNQNTR